MLNEAHSQCFDIIIEVTVGDPAQGTLVHKGILCKHSAACREIYQDNQIELERVETGLAKRDVRGFQIYVRWIDGRLTDLRQAVREWTSQHHNGSKPQIFLWCELWLLGDLLKDEDFCDAVMEELLKEGEDSLRVFAYHKQNGPVSIVGQTPRASMLWFWLMDAMARIVHSRRIEEVAKDWPQDMLIGVLGNRFKRTRVDAATTPKLSQLRRSVIEAFDSGS